MRQILAILLLISFAFSVTVTEPVGIDVKSGDLIEAGEIGPGQTILITVEPHVSEGGKFGQGGDYDLAIPTDLPANWEGKQSKLYGKPLQIFITAAKDAPEGEYLANITVQDANDDRIDEIKFAVKIKITWDVLDIDVTPSEVSVGPGQPARYEISITNKGTASDVFDVSSTGLKKWQFKRSVHVPPKSTKTVTYELVENDEETYNPTIIVSSSASNLIKKEKTVSFKVNTNLVSDYKATNHGVIIMPIFESMVYSFIGFISNLF
ncbi:hypothetical protein J4450_05760 [Candidatus Micrarchaeota archaeon]|nr:hypothetical protein [Candidatus Micrarchaeota archaeon]